MRWKD